MGSVIIMIVDICGVYPNVSSVGISSCRWFAAEMCVGINFIINIIVSLVWLFCNLVFYGSVWYFKGFIIRSKSSLPSDPFCGTIFL